MDSFRARQIELIYAPVLAMRVEAGWYDGVEKELEKNLAFVRMMDVDSVSEIYEQARLWLDSVKEEALENGKDSLLNRDHRLVTLHPDHILNVPFYGSV
ncbi:hypothetical protein FJ938_23705 [Mesorhizobium sp. B2-4-14]|uniref:hypothetical protein n=1 Tax=Mesorhizobium sp. B2-4-14 TaxID=2589935 RepID=UPI00112E2C57|nr:hypothetical protein [Mesorhizobium sp. B2-4-14]TPK99832.1 hypothetical protein FJ938_23705 [Mesorhizobium sp. B2-4-14]